MLSAKFVTAHFQAITTPCSTQDKLGLVDLSGPIDYRVKKVGIATGPTTGLLGNNWLDVFNSGIPGVRSLALVVQSDNNMPFGKQVVLTVAFW